MSNLSVLGYGEIRQTEDDRYSVFDTIVVIGGKSNPRKTWSDICKQYPEVVTKSDNFQFEGQGQRLTPVAYKEDILYIIGLLPGAVGRSYREDAAKLVTAKLNGEMQLSTDSPTVVDKLLEVQSQMQGLMQQNQQMMMAIAMMCQQQGIQMQSLVSQVASVDSRLNQIEVTQQEAIASLDEIPEPEIEAEGLTTRAKLNRLVRDYSTANAIQFPEVWRRIYREFRDRYHVDLKARAKNLPAKFGALDVCEQLGKIEELYAVAFELLKV
jgi:hypothetical protein